MWLKILIVIIIISIQVLAYFLSMLFFNISVFLACGALCSLIILKIFLNLEKEKKILEESDRKNRALVEHAHDCIFTLDLQGNLKFLNRKAEKIIGYSVDEMLHKPMALLLPPEARENFFEMVQKVARGGSVPPYEIDIDTVYGKRNFEMSILAVKNQEKVVGIEIVGRDVTENRKLKEELNKKKLDIKKLSKRLMNRDLKILELKKKIKALEKKLGI